MIWAMILKPALGGLWGLLSAIPRQVWLALALIAAVYVWHSRAVDTAWAEGIETERAAWVEAQRVAKAKAEKEAKEQQAKIDTAAKAAKEEADNRFASLDTKFQDLRERLRHANESKPGAPAGVPDPCRISDQRRDLLNAAIGYD